MRYCLSCRSLSSPGAICSRCGRSFDGRLCPSGHLSGFDANFCSQCRSQTLTDGAASLRLGGALRFLLLVAAFFATRWLLASTDWGSVLQQKASSAYGWLVFQAAQIGFLLLFCWFLGGLIMPPVQKAVERIVVRLFLLVFKVIEKLLVLLFRLMSRGLGGGVGR